MKECGTVEWKESVSNSFLKTVSAFANYGSGSVVFGIADDGSVKGLADTRAACLDIENKINDSIDPTPFFSLTENTRKKTVTLAVEEGPNKPYLYRGKAYRRSDTATVEVDNVELRRLVLAGQNMHFEELPCHKQDLTFRALEEKLEAEHVVKALNGDVLRTFNLFNFEAGFNNAALIVSDQNTFPGIDVARFGENINIIADRATFEGASVIEQIDGTCTMFERYYSVETIEGARRTTHYSIPYEAFREAVANAVAHRTWDVNAKIRIAMHPDHIEISSPGGLPAGLGRDEYLRGFISQLRNPILANVLFRLNIIEMFGTGIVRIRSSYAEYEQKPEFDVSENAVRVTLPVTDARSALTSDEELVYRFVKEEGSAASGQIVANFGFGKDKAVKLLRSLVEKRYVEKTGTGRGTKYHA